MTNRTFLLTLSAVLALAAAPAGAQTRGGVAGAGLMREAYRFSDPDATGLRSLSLLTLPFAARTSLSPSLTLDVSGAFARGSLEHSDGSRVTLSGLTDTRVGLTAAVVPDRLSVGAIALLPTGKQKQTDAEAELAGAIGADLLPFRISNWSTGGGIGLSSSLVHSTGAIGFGVTASYVVGREFDLLESEEFAYRPGNQLVVRGAVDATVGTAGKLSFALTFERASEDRVNGSNLYRPGNRIQGTASYAFRAGVSGSGVGYAGVFHRSSGVYLLDAVDEAAAEDLLLAGGGLRIPFASTVLLPSVDVRIVRRADGNDQGFLLGAGSSLEWTNAAGLTLEPSLRARFGRVLAREGVETGFTGLDIGLVVRLRRHR